MSSAEQSPQWDERTSAPGSLVGQSGLVFESFFERSVDAVWLFDPQAGVFLDCNDAAVKLIGAKDKAQLLQTTPMDLSPPFQPNGATTRERTAQIIALVEKHNGYRFEWTMRRKDGRDVPLEVSCTPILMSGRNIHVVVARDISERKQAEQESFELNQSLERRVAERTAELTTSEARLRAVVEHAPEAIVVFDGNTGRFLFGNEHACRLYGVAMEKLAQLTPAEVSPKFQPDGRLSSESAREKMVEALAGGKLVFDWLHQQPNGRLIPTEVRLLRLPAEGQNLIRASIIDNTERKRAESALRESEAKFRALFEGSSQGVVLHDENGLREVNPAAVRIMGRRSPSELIGKQPQELAPPFQPNGESSEVIGRRYIEECMAKGSARFDWVAQAPDGRDIPLEVAITRIEWSGRQVIQAFITDIAERKQAEHALRNANQELHREVEHRTRAEELLKERVKVSSLNAEVALALNANIELQPMLQRCAELMVQYLDVAFVRVWTLNAMTEVLELQASAGCYTHLDGAHSRIAVGQHKIGAIARDKQPLLTNSVEVDPHISDRAWAQREGMQAFAGYPLLIEDRVLGVLAMFARRPLGEDILKTIGSLADSVSLGVERKRAQTALAESEARFSLAFQASPIFIAISRASDGRFVLVNDAFVNWSGYSREEMLGHNALELGLWENAEERAVFWADLRRDGSLRERECRFLNREGKKFTMLASSELIRLNHVPHMLAMSLDISERTEAEAELRASEARLRESEARFSVAFQASPVFISILRMSDGKYVLANDALLKWAGYSREEVLGRTSAELGMWERQEERDSVWGDLRTVGSIRQRECRWLNRHGKLFTILLSAETITLNNMPHILSLAQDITQRKRAEEELLRTVEREKELSQLRSNFVSMVSHEFRTPLGIIQSSAELLRDFYDRMPTSEREDQLDSISRNTRRMAGMMEAVLALSRLDAGKLIFQPAALDINRCCRHIVDEVLSAMNRRCAIELNCPTGLPEARADERLLGHIFSNLLSNAIKYSAAGATVYFSVKRNGDEAVCVVRDQGIGISETDQQELFKAFHRGANVGTRPGTGLGLLLVKRCADLHGGQVQLESRLGEGTTVTVKLPLFWNVA